MGGLFRNHLILGHDSGLKRGSSWECNKMAIYSIDGIVDSEEQLELPKERWNKSEGMITYCCPPEPSIFGEIPKFRTGWAYYFPSEDQFKRFTEEMHVKNTDDLVSKHLLIYLMQDVTGDNDGTCYAIEPIK